MARALFVALVIGGCCVVALSSLVIASGRGIAVAATAPPSPAPSASASPAAAPAAAAPDASPSPFGDTSVLPTARIKIMISRPNHTPLPGALVPKLEPNDKIEAWFPSFDFRSRPPQDRSTWWRYHGDVTFINAAPPFVQIPGTQTAPGTKDALDAIWTSTDSVPTISFTYDPGYDTPVFLIIPEKSQAGDWKSALSFVQRDATKFYRSNATIAADAAAKSTWLSDFTAAITSQSLDVTGSGRNYITGVVKQFGVDDKTISDCYSAAGATKESIARCLEKSIATTSQQNSTPQTQAKLAGTLASIAVGGHISPVFFAASTLYNVFFKPHAPTGAYKFVPAAMLYRYPTGSSSSAGGYEELAVAEVPPNPGTTDNPYAFYFTVGDQHSSQSKPSFVLDASAAQGVCARDPATSVPIPMHLQNGSQYVHDLKLVGAGAVRTHNNQFSLPLDSAGATAVAIKRSAIPPVEYAYRTSLTGQYGFDPIDQIGQTVLVAVPHNSNWTPAHDALNPAYYIAGSRAVVRFRSPSVPCLTAVSVVQGASRPLSYQRVDGRPDQVDVTIDLSSMTNGKATIVFSQDDPLQPQPFRDQTTLDIQKPPPVVDPAAPQVVYQNDKVVELVGKQFDGAVSLSVLQTTFVEDLKHYSATSACFVASQPPATSTLGPTTGMFTLYNLRAGPTAPLTVVP
ncbi:MAG: hypothetical protein QOJ39_1362, partial [Candidatus Eremiobacteraeota bacterium]|nr:hypothetical protein [Candidatus Eremiobacteraeota bacterium]